MGIHCGSDSVFTMLCSGNRAVNAARQWDTKVRTLLRPSPWCQQQSSKGLSPAGATGHLHTGPRLFLLNTGSSGRSEYFVEHI